VSHFFCGSWNFQKIVNFFFQILWITTKTWFKDDPPSKNIFPHCTSFWISSLLLSYFSFAIFFWKENTQLNAMMSFNHFHFFIWKKFDKNGLQISSRVNLFFLQTFLKRWIEKEIGLVAQKIPNSKFIWQKLRRNLKKLVCFKTVSVTSVVEFCRRESTRA